MNNEQLELPLAKAYPAGGNVMVDNLWYKDAQEGIQVKPFASSHACCNFFFSRLSKKSGNQFSPMVMKKFKVELKPISERNKDDSQLIVKHMHRLFL